MFTVKFDTAKFTKQIKGIQNSAIPEAQKNSLKQFGFFNKKKMMPYMSSIFRNPVPLTLKSVLFKIEDEDSMFFFIRSVGKGNSPRKYLGPVEFRSGGLSTAYETKFSYWFRNYSGLGLSNRYPIPVLDSTAVEKNSRGTGMKASQYTKVKAGLIKSKGTGKITGNQYRYFAVPANGKKGRGKLANAEGIYRVKGNQLGLLFTLAKKQPQVPQIFEFRGRTIKHLNQKMPNIFTRELRRAVAKFK